MKNIVIYGRRNTGMIAIPYLMAKGFRVHVISDYGDVIAVAKSLGCLVGQFESIQWLEYDLFLCVHGDRIIPKEWIKEGKMVNIHPCLSLYKGHNPIKKYIDNRNKVGSVDSHFIVEQVDEGPVIHSENFYTGVVSDYASFYNLALPFYLKTIHKTLKKLGV